MKTAFFVVTMSCPSGDHCRHEADGIAGVWSAHAAIWNGLDIALLDASKVGRRKQGRDHVLETRLFISPSPGSCRPLATAAFYNMTVRRKAHYSGS
jgi:hypothetical protein